jgi:hypothetical protein
MTEQNLMLISSIRPGDTITKVFGNLVVTHHDSYLTKSYRTFIGSDTRDTVYLYINNIISNAIYQNVPITSCVIIGLVNIKKTYEQDAVFCKRIDDMIETIKRRTQITPLNSILNDITLPSASESPSHAPSEPIDIPVVSPLAVHPLYNDRMTLSTLSR